MIDLFPMQSEFSEMHGRALPGGGDFIFTGIKGDAAYMHCGFTDSYTLSPV